MYHFNTKTLKAVHSIKKLIRNLIKMLVINDRLKHRRAIKNQQEGVYKRGGGSVKPRHDDYLESNTGVKAKLGKKQGMQKVWQNREAMQVFLEMGWDGGLLACLRRGVTEAATITLASN